MPSDTMQMLGRTTAAAFHGTKKMLDQSLNETVVRLAVTGLSRAGKTVFITSLIQNLLAAGKGRDTLSALRTQLEGADGTSRLRTVRALPAGAGAMPYFDHAEKFADLAAASPAWPPRTDDLATISLDIELDRDGALGRLGPKRIRLELLDYPGEWLLDLPLRDKGFAAWSDETLALIRQPPRAVLFAPFLDFLAGFDPAAPANSQQLRHGHALYRDALNACRTQLGLRFLQPGRFLCPGPRGEAPLMWFFPCESRLGGPVRGSGGALLQDRYDAYKADMAANFFDTHFIDFDRQVVLVDVLGALHAGQAAFEDTERAIAAIAGCMTYGRSLPKAIAGLGNLTQRVGGRVFGRASSTVSTLQHRRIERMAFVATKADHVPAMRRANLCNLLRSIVEAAAARLDPQGVSYHAAASVLSTTDRTMPVQGRPAEEVVVGVVLGDTRQRSFYPGEVPSGRPPPSFWTDRFFELPTFTPPRLDPSGAVGIPHLGLDEVLATILKGRL